MQRKRIEIGLCSTMDAPGEVDSRFRGSIGRQEWRCDESNTWDKNTDRKMWDMDFQILRDTVYNSRDHLTLFRTADRVPRSGEPRGCVSLRRA